ncbi:sensor histidine kinase [Alicyclobacillus shizuokensis]|uniref:sensor histidine kinase n=1 Tax=Alicyclobacillus shizuokensis TaxID=392014 RepID=UPI000831C353|nr:HAMP domain-containing sensor histidine kinase [Alicyclobacillus shizuokensis]MCL6625190.1 HAMP domain-containing histidine kinase [Alicyclobacillus shizuokensis]
MKTVRIRKYMVVGVLSIVVFPWLVYCLVLQPWSQWHRPRQQIALNQAMNEIIKNPGDWTNPAWQNHLRKQLTDAGMEATILSPSNHEIFSSGHRHGPQWMPSQQTTVVENGQVLGTVRVFASTTNENSAIAAISALAAVILAIFFVGFQMGRHVVKPLESMSRAARQIAEGDLDFRLPVSRVTEIAQVRSGFEIMVAGLRESFQKQARLEEERRFFIGAIAHDLRTPLFALRGYLDGLEQGIANTPEKMAKYVAVCKEKSNQLDRLVSDLFAFTKLEYMEQTLHYDEVDLACVLEASVDSLRPQAQDKAVSIIMERPAYGCVVWADSHLLERAINNLLDNALRHTPSGGEIFVKWHKEPGKTILSVRDTGPGFSGEELNHVFDPLYRGEASRNRATGGVGLGLTIARRIFRAHGGDLVATNHPEGGALLTGWVQDA